MPPGGNFSHLKEASSLYHSYRKQHCRIEQIETLIDAMEARQEFTSGEIERLWEEALRACDLIVSAGSRLPDGRDREKRIERIIEALVYAAG